MYGNTPEANDFLRHELYLIARLAQNLADDMRSQVPLHEEFTEAWEATAERVQAIANRIPEEH